ncbi:MAG: hypothetical protein AB7O59_21275 [Pirellulales bacterium]
MSSTRAELESFHSFVVQRLANGESGVSLEELFSEWQDGQSRDEINHAIRLGLADVEAGRYEPADRAMDAIRQQLDVAKE